MEIEEYKSVCKSLGLVETENYDDEIVVYSLMDGTEEAINVEFDESQESDMTGIFISLGGFYRAIEEGFSKYDFHDSLRMRTDVSVEVFKENFSTAKARYEAAKVHESEKEICLSAMARYCVSYHHMIKESEEKQVTKISLGMTLRELHESLKKIVNEINKTEEAHEN